MNSDDSRFHRALLVRLQAINDEIHAICEHYRSQAREEQPPSQVDIQSPIRLPPTVTRYYESEEGERLGNTRRDKIRLAIEIIGMAAAISAGVFAYRTVREVQRQSDAAQKQIGIMRQQLEATDRAWIRISEVKPTKFLLSETSLAFSDPKLPPYPPKPQVMLSLEVDYENVGHSVALNIQTLPELYLSRGRDDGRSVEIEEKRFCDLADGNEREPARRERGVLFPGETSSVKYPAPGGGVKSDIGEDNAFVGEGGKYIVPTLIVCLVYGDESSLTRHRTRAVYEPVESVEHKFPGLHNLELPTDSMGRNVFLVGKDVDQAVLFLRRVDPDDLAN